MPCYNHQYIPRRTRVKSCPAGVSFEVNDISNYTKRSGLLQKSNAANLFLSKESNCTQRRRQSFPSGKQKSFANETSLHQLNYSNVAGGRTHNLFSCKLVEARHMLTRSLVDVSNQRNYPNKSAVHDSFVASFQSGLPLDNILDSSSNLASQNPLDCQLNENPVEYKINSSCEIQAVDVNGSTFSLLKEVEHSAKALCYTNETAKHLDSAFLSEFLERVNGLEDIDFEDNFSQILKDGRIVDSKDLRDSDLERLRCNVHGTELLVEHLANQVGEAKEETEMSKKKQENELNDLISLNEEMQTIWSEKESEVREILERFSAYRDAVEADSKEKDEIFAEELNKREVMIKDLQLAKDALADELQQKMEAFREIINDVENFDATHAKQLGDVNQLVAILLETLSDQEASVVCQSICVKLETSIATIKGKDYARYISCLSVGTGVASTEGVKRNYGDFKLGKSLSSSIDEGTGYSILSSSDGERNECSFSSNASGSVLACEQSAPNNVMINREQFSADDFSSCAPVDTGNDEFYEALEEDFEKLLKEIEERAGGDGLVNGYVDRKIVVKLLEEQVSKYQLICQEKDDEIQHWIRKHKQDTKDFQSILEEQERNEAKNAESLAELKNEIEKLRQRNKFLESEVEFTKEQGEDDVCLLKESFQKDLSAQLRRQTESFLSAEESTNNRLAELESKNEELRKGNEVLRRQFADQCKEIKSWVSHIFLLSEVEYNEEFGSTTDVLAKLQKIIIENKRTMEALQEELNEHRSRANEPSSPTSTLLSRSWGGHSWNSMEMQKDLCRNCKQVKWQRVLMGSFDLVETALEVKQDDMEIVVDKLNIDETKYRKKHSLKDSLELADDQLEHLQRLSRLGLDSLETVDEDSTEEGGNIDERGILDDCHSSDEKNSEADKDENCDESWKNIHVSPRILSQYSLLSDPECDGLSQETENDESRGSGNTEIGGRWSQDVETNSEVEMTREDVEMSGDKEEQCWIEQEGKGKEEDQDRVQVVNLYRSLIVESCTPQDKDIVDGRVNNNESGEKFGGKSRDESGDLVTFNDNSGDKLDHEFDDQTAFPDDVADKLVNQSGHQITSVNKVGEESDVPHDVHFQIPRIIIGKDINENKIQDKQGDNVEENYFNEISEKTSYFPETQEVIHPVLTDESKAASEISEFWAISTDPKNSIFEFTGNFQDELPPCTPCAHCSRSFIENLENFKTKITEIISNQCRDRENRIRTDLENTRTELREFQSEYEKMEKICDDYRDYIDEYSGNLRRKNEELRKLKMSCGIMRTEIEWLRQALGITKNYAEF